MEKPILAAALSFWSSATNTMNLPLGYMSPTILDICTLTGLSPVGVEISANHDLPTTFGDGMLPPKFQDKDEQKEAINKLKRSRNYSTLYKKYAMTDSNSSDQKSLCFIHSSHLSVEKCFTMLYTLRNLKNFSVCYSQ